MRWILTMLVFGFAAAAHAEWTLSSRNVTATLPGGAEFIEREAKQGDGVVRVKGVFFTMKQARFAVSDNAEKISLGEAMKSTGALAGVNGNYFKADWTPVGLELAAGNPVHGFERAKLLSGVFVVTKGVPRIVRSGIYTSSKNDTDALQAGPFLVEKGAAIPGLNATRAARRTVVATDGKGRWAILIFSPVTLAETADLLASRAVFPDFPVVHALNMDGGSSTALWVATEPRPFYYSEFGRVRNFLTIMPH
ncbi:MAG: phosphodiester glycosidase family protein [Chthoniobacterales bacterium]